VLNLARFPRCACLPCRFAWCWLCRWSCLAQWSLICGRLAAAQLSMGCLELIYWTLRRLAVGKTHRSPPGRSASVGGRACTCRRPLGARKTQGWRPGRVSINRNAFENPWLRCLPSW